MCTLTKTTRTSPLFKQSLIGLNDDEAAVLNFSTIPYYGGHNLLQRCHFFVVPRVLGLSSQFSFVVRYRTFCLGNRVAEHTKPPREALGRPRDQERSAQHRNTLDILAQDSPNRSTGFMFIQTHNGLSYGYSCGATVFCRCNRQAIPKGTVEGTKSAPSPKLVKRSVQGSVCRLPHQSKLTKKHHCRGRRVCGGA